MTTPNQIPNLSFWAKGDAGVYQDAGTTTPCVLAGDLVQHWVDQSAAGNDASQATAANRPTYQPNPLDAINGIPTVRFPNINNVPAFSVAIANLAPGGNAFTTFFLARAGTEGSTIQIPLWFGPAASLVIEMVNQRLCLFGASGGSVNSTLRIPMRPQVWGFASNGTTVTLYLDQAMYRANANFSGAWSSGVLGFGTVGGTNYPIKMDLAEVVLYSRALSGTEIAGLLSYFEGRGGIAPVSTKTRLLVFDGDSLTAGGDTGAQATPLTLNYPNQLVPLLDTTWEAYNFGNSGSVSATLLSNRPTFVDPLLNPIAYTSATLVLWVGSNDVANNVTPATAWANVQSYLSGAASAGWTRIGVLTVLPSTAFNSGQEANRQTLNASIRNGWKGAGASFLVDVGQDPYLGVPGAATNPLWFADGTHLTQAGYNRVANLVGPPVGGPSSVQNLLWSFYPGYQQTIQVVLGTDQLLSFTPVAGPINITGRTPMLTVRQRYGTPILLTKSGASVYFTNPGVGNFSVALLSADSQALGVGDYVCDVCFTDSGANDCISTGLLSVLPEVRL